MATGMAVMAIAMAAVAGMARAMVTATAAVAAMATAMVAATTPNNQLKEGGDGVDGGCRRGPETQWRVVGGSSLPTNTTRWGGIVCIY
jgi:hypothetical protein